MTIPGYGDSCRRRTQVVVIGLMGSSSSSPAEHGPLLETAFSRRVNRLGIQCRGCSRKSAPCADEFEDFFTPLHVTVATNRKPSMLQVGRQAWGRDIGWDGIRRQGVPRHAPQSSAAGLASKMATTRHEVSAHK